MEVLQPGIYGLSNQQLDSPWKKVVHGKQRFSEIVGSSQSKQQLVDQLMDLLCSSTWYARCAVRAVDNVDSCSPQQCTHNVCSVD